MELHAHSVLAMFAAGMGIAFAVADRRSPSSCLIGTGLVLLGITIELNSWVVPGRPMPPLRSALAGLADAGAGLMFSQWVLRVRRTIPSRGLRTAWGDGLLREAQALVIVYGALSVAFPELRAQAFASRLASPAAFVEPSFLLFFVPFATSVAFGVVATALVLNRRPDHAEKVRLIAACAAAPLISAGLVLPADVATITSTIGLLVFLVGMLRYQTLQGERAQFLARFLSPEVAELVRRRGLEGAIGEATTEVSVVACDLRGFTALSAALPSAEIIRLLDRYYACVGEIVLERGGTIKDQAGDGVLILIGAPIARPDHARRALDLAAAVRDRLAPLLAQWSGVLPDLGVGIGIASGTVTVGVIGGAGRLEYVAVGAAVNLASRLCDVAT
ncbi:MAG: adenylate cyclase, partial [Candidatus Binatota bacterium]|nr:adenylate cyclase [Candidatus Binatota bacterium]